MSAAVDIRPNRSVQQAAGRVTLSLEFITPACAKAWRRDLNIRNFRRYSDDTAAKYADDMVAGQFGATPEMASESNIVICVDPDTGESFLGNGQHRLGGCEIAGKRASSFEGFWCGVMRGTDPMAMLRMDVGKKRSLTDYLRFLDVPNANVVTPALRILHTYKSKPDQLATKLAGTADQLLHLLENRADINRAVKFALNHSTGKNRSIPMTTSWLTVARMLTSEVAGVGTDADQFWSLLATRNDDIASITNHPVTQMRRFLDTKGTLTLKQYRMAPSTTFGTVLKCWNNWRDDKLSTLVFRPGQEPWPIPR